MDNFFYPARFGYACKWMDPTPTGNKKEDSDRVARMNLKGTTKKYVQSLDSHRKQFDKISGIVLHNIQALRNQIDWLSEQPIHMRMLRIGSDMLPFYTLDELNWFYSDYDLMDQVERGLRSAGEKARRTGVRLSMHPGQFCILNSANPDVVERSIEEFEYHCDIMRWMGFTGWHPYGMEINVHGGSGREGLEPLKNTITKRLSQDARDWLTIENCEYSFGVKDLAKISDICALVLDVHHHFIHSQGKYIQPNSPEVQPFIESWRGVVPELHYSISPEEFFEDSEYDALPDYKILTESGIGRQKLRQHSNMSWNSATNDWVLGFSNDFDIMVEAKNKNLASQQLFDFARFNRKQLFRTHR